MYGTNCEKQVQVRQEPMNPATRGFTDLMGSWQGDSVASKATV